jgi:hypothetical protein
LRVRRGRIGDRRVISRGPLLAPIAQQGPSKKRRPVRREWAVVPEVPREYTPKPRIRSFRLLTSWLHRFGTPHRIFIHTSFRRRRDTQLADAAKLIAKGNIVTKINLRTYCLKRSRALIGTCAVGSETSVSERSAFPRESFSCLAKYRLRRRCRVGPAATSSPTVSFGFNP